MKTKSGLIAVFGTLFFVSIVSCGEQAKEDSSIKIDAELEEFMEHLKIFDVVRGDGFEGYVFQISPDGQGNFTSTIRKSAERKSADNLSNARIQGGGELCRSEDLDLDFARCAKKQAKRLGCIVIRECFWCAYPCDEVSQIRPEDEEGGDDEGEELGKD